MKGAKLGKLNFLNNETFDGEIVHHYDDNLLITSLHRNVELRMSSGKIFKIQLPGSVLDVLGFSRLCRRFFRLDKCNVFPLDANGDELLLIRQSFVYRWDKMNGLRCVHQLHQSRNVLHLDLCSTNDGRLYLGEYGSNKSRDSVPIYSSLDNGATWFLVYEIPAGKAKHVHGVYFDEFADKIWVLTGDAQGECWVIEADKDFKQPVYHGDGGQRYRACTMFFTENTVVWGMDSPLEKSRIVHFDRATREITLHGDFGGPIWYGIQSCKGDYLITSTVEPGAAVTSDRAQIFHSTDLVNWESVFSLKKDAMPMGLFKFGVLAFSRGTRSDGSCYIFGEAVQSLDGKATRVELDDPIFADLQAPNVL